MLLVTPALPAVVFTFPLVLMLVTSAQRDRGCGALSTCSPSPGMLLPHSRIHLGEFSCVCQCCFSFTGLQIPVISKALCAFYIAWMFSLLTLSAIASFAHFQVFISLTSRKLQTWGPQLMPHFLQFLAHSLILCLYISKFLCQADST